jgi:hypothetical protein
MWVTDSVLGFRSPPSEADMGRERSMEPVRTSWISARFSCSSDLGPMLKILEIMIGKKLESEAGLFTTRLLTIVLTIVYNFNAVSLQQNRRKTAL